MKKILLISSTMQIQSHLLPWGNGLAVRITQPMAKVSGITAHSRVRVTVKPGRITIEKSPQRVTLEEMLAKFDPARHSGELMAYSPAGHEIL